MDIEGMDIRIDHNKFGKKLDPLVCVGAAFVCGVSPFLHKEYVRK